MAPIGPRYLPCSVIAAWRCFTSTSGFACASASSEAPPSAASATAAANNLILIRFSSERSFYNQIDGERRHGKQNERAPRTGKARRHTLGRVRRQMLHPGEHGADEILLHDHGVIPNCHDIHSSQQQQHIHVPV